MTDLHTLYAAYDSLAGDLARAEAKLPTVMRGSTEYYRLVSRIEDYKRRMNSAYQHIMNLQGGNMYPNQQQYYQQQQQPYYMQQGMAPMMPMSQPMTQPMMPMQQYGQPVPVTPQNSTNGAGLSNRYGNVRETRPASAPQPTAPVETEAPVQPVPVKKGLKTLVYCLPGLGIENGKVVVTNESAYKVSKKANYFQNEDLILAKEYSPVPLYAKRRMTFVVNGLLSHLYHDAYIRIGDFEEDYDDLLKELGASNELVAFERLSTLKELVSDAKRCLMADKPVESTIVSFTEALSRDIEGDEELVVFTSLAASSFVSSWLEIDLGTTPVTYINAVGDKVSGLMVKIDQNTLLLIKF